jgi:beta-lactamase regulating signal transducer with metallopeptidase domain
MESLVHVMLNNALVATSLAAVVACLGRARRRPALIHGLWLLVMIKLVTPPVVSVTVPIASVVAPVAEVDSGQDDVPTTAPSPGASGAVTEPIATEFTPHPESLVLDRSSDTSPAATSRPEDPPSLESKITLASLAARNWENMFLGMILSGALAWWALAVTRVVRFQRLLRSVQPVCPEWQARAAELADRLKLVHPPAVSLVPGRVPPMLWALGGPPRLLLPSQLWATMSEDERTSLLLHELAHLRRRDHWVRWLELFVGGLYWWLPTAWWIRRSLREAEEQCCDAWVVWAMPTAARTYAAALLAAVEFVSRARNTPVAASATSGIGHVACLKRRLRMIMRANTPKGLSWPGRLALMGAAALLLPLAPSWAQKNNSQTGPNGLDRPAAVHDATDDVNVARAQDRVQPGQEAKGGDLLDTWIDRLVALIEKGLSTAESSKTEELEDRISEKLMQDPDVVARGRELAQVRERLDQANRVARLPNDPARLAAKRQLEQLTDQYTRLLNEKDQQLRAQVTRDDENEKSGQTKESRETAEKLEGHLQELIEKLGKEFGPVGEQVKNTLEQAVREVHQALQKEDVSVEDLRQALERSCEKLRGAIEEGGPVKEELRKALDRSKSDLEEMRKAMERSGEDARDALERSRREIRERAGRAREEARRAREEVEKAMRERLARERERQRELAKKAQPDNPRENEARAARERAEAERADRQRLEADRERRAAGEREGQPDRQELESARREIRELEQQLRRATRRLEELERRESRREAAPRRPAGPRAETPPSPRSPAQPAAPATRARPATPGDRRPQASPGGPGARSDYERRFRQLDEKLDQLLKELEKMKDEKQPSQPRSRDGRAGNTGRALES